MEKNLSYLIDEVVKLDSFWNANYYLRSMKKAPHGGIEYVTIPNFYLKYRPTGLWALFARYSGVVPTFLQKLVDDTLKIWNECQVDMNEFLYFCFDNDFWYAGMRVLKTKEGITTDGTLLMSVLAQKLPITDYFKTNNIEEIMCAFVCYLIEEKMLVISDLNEIKRHEKLLDNHNKYGLSLLRNAKFGRQGYYIGDEYYLYNCFFDISIGRAIAETPLTVELFNLIPNIDIYMRCDKLLSVPKDKAICTATTDFQKFRGISLLWDDIEKLVYGKEIVVHGNPKTLNKLLLVIKKDEEPNGQVCFHIELEELWNPDRIRDDIVALTYIHAKYLLEKKAFIHMDYSVNQYKTDVYRLKYNDAANGQGITIDKYADVHYKIWCIEGKHIDVGMWSALVSATLDYPFRDLFIEMFPDAQSENVT